MDPKDFQGAMHIIGLGIGAALVALVIANFFPSLIPVAVTTVKL
jgi:hypothetical protein